MRTIMSAAALSMLLASPAEAIRSDECEQQRALFPKEWNDVSKEKPLFFCWSHYSGAFKVTLGTADDKGRRLMSLVPLERNDAKVSNKIRRKTFFAFGWTRNRAIGCKKESILRPSYGKRNLVGLAGRFPGRATAKRTRSSSLTAQTPNPTAPTRVRSTTRLRASACFRATLIVAKRSSSAPPRARNVGFSATVSTVRNLEAAMRTRFQTMDRLYPR